MTPSEQIDKLIEGLEDWRGDMLAKVRKTILAADRGIVEEWKWMGSPVSEKNGILVVGNAHKDKVKLTFQQGAKLEDPDKLFNNGFGGGVWRAIDIRKGDKVDAAALKKLVRAAIAFNQAKAKKKAGAPRAGSGAAAKPKTAAKTAGTATTKAASKTRPPLKPNKDGVVLLSGGNPQIAKGDGDAPVQAYIAAMPGWKRDIGKRLDALIDKTVPHLRKAVKWNSPFYGVEGQGWFLNFHVFPRYVKVAFFKGGSLKPLPPKASKHAEVRYLDIGEDGFDEKQMEKWLKQAAAIPGWMT